MDTKHHQEKQQFKRLFEEQGIDRVEDRLAILEVFLDIEEHVTSDDLAAALTQNGYGLDLRFVRKTLGLLCRYGFAVKKEFEGKPVLYEHRHLGLHHDHLICTKCGCIEEFESRPMEDLQLQIAAMHGFHVLQHKMEIYGLCSECLDNRVRLMPLSVAQGGELVVITDFLGGADAQLRLATIGIRNGDEVEVVTNSGKGQIIVGVAGIRVALERGMATKIIVRPNGRRKGRA